MAKVKDRRGRRQRSRTHTARTRAPNLDRYYAHRLPPITPGDFTFELTLLASRARPSIDITRIVESFQWDDTTDMMQGTMQLRRPHAWDASSIPVKSGDRVRCRTHWGGTWYELWTMRCEAPADNGDTATATVIFKDDLDLLSRTKRHWHFRTRKSHKHGYLGHDVTRAVARREGVRVGRIAECTHRNPKLSMYASGLAVIRAAYQYEAQKTGRKFVIRMRNGLLEVLPYQRNPILYVLATQIRTLATQQHPGSPNPASVLTGIARIGKGKHAKTIRYTEFNRAVIRRIGKVEREKHYRNIGSRAELRAAVRRDLAKMLRLNLTATVQHQGIPFIARGDGARIDLAGEYFHGARSYVYVNAVRHQVQAGAYTSEFDITTVDPFLKDRQRVEAELRARKRKQRKRGAHA